MINVGDKIGTRYQVSGTVGSGGMQDVFKAYDTLLEREVALKTPQLGQKHKRFKASAIISGRVNHHNVAKTLDYFEYDSQPFLVEELVDGCDLEKLVTEQYSILDPHLAAEILVSLMKGVQASHSAGVVHRDLKPSNVMTAKVNGHFVAKITDFGIATLTESLFDEAPHGDLTRSSSKTIQGALPYMAPEMMFRKAGDYPDKEADIWSIGAMMFRLLTGEYAFGEGFEAPANIRTSNRTPWPSWMSANSQYSSLAGELQKIIEGCLIYDKYQRASSDSVIAECEKLCFSTGEREEGIVNRRIYSTQFLIGTAKGNVFLHQDSVYGRVPCTVGSRVSFSRHYGTPFPRAHPVVVMRDP